MQYYPEYDKQRHHLERIWNTEIYEKELERTRQTAYDEHKEATDHYSNNPFSHEAAMALTVTATASDLLPRPFEREPEPPPWPCEEHPNG